jgi:excisionase family DNA binding protein
MGTHEILAFTIQDACRALGIGKTNLYRLIAQRKIEARALGGRTVIPADSLRAFVATLPKAPIKTHEMREGC